MNTNNEEKKNKAAEVNGAKEPVPYIVHEGVMARMERSVKRLWVLVVLLILLLVGTNVAWLIYEAQFEDQTTVTQDVDTQQSPAYVNGTGSMKVDGKSTSDNH